MLDAMGAAEVLVEALVEALVLVLGEEPLPAVSVVLDGGLALELTP
jgi:hypothetical protein